jgi:hypothetical protein
VVGVCVVSTLALISLVSTTDTAHAVYNIGMFWRASAWSFIWPFDTNTSTQYSFGPQVEISGGVARMKPVHNDLDGSMFGFGAGTWDGVIWDAANSVLRLGRSDDEYKFTSNWTPYWANLSGVYHLDEANGSGTVTPEGVVTASATVTGVTLGVRSRIGTGALFSGSGSDIAAGSYYDLQAQDFSFSFWINLTSLASASAPFYKGPWQQYGYYCQITSAGVVEFATNQSGAGQKSSTAAGSITANAWYHVAITRTGSSVRIYVNGKDATSVAATHINPATSSDSFSIGKYPTGPIGTNGIIDELAIWSGAKLSAEEVWTIYNRQRGEHLPTNRAELDSSWTPQYSSIASYWKFEDNWRDSVGSNHLTPVGNSAFTTVENGKIGAGAALDGVGDYADGTMIAFTDKFSVSMWINPTSGSDDQSPLFAQGVISTNTANSIIIRRENNSNLHVAVRSGGVTTQSMGYIDSLRYGVWSHIVVVFDTGTVSVYQDGKAVGVAASVDTEGDVGAGALSIGRALYLVDKYWKGGIDDVAFWASAALTSGEVEKIYERQSVKYSGTFTSRVMDAFSTGQSWTSLSWKSSLPFSKELPDYNGGIQNETSTAYSSLVGSSGSVSDNDLMSGIIGLWHLNETAATGGPANDFNDESGNSRHLEQANTVIFGEKGILGNGVRFTGINEYVKATVDGTALTVLSVSFWIKSDNATQTSRGIFQWAETISSQNPFLLVQQMAGDLRFYFDGDYRITATITPLVWQHVAITLNSSNLWTAYVNGVSVGTYQDDATHFAIANANFVFFGNGYNGYYVGTIDEAAVWNRSLHATEVAQLYRRGVNRLKYQVRICTADDCSDDATGANWKGPDGTRYSYFSELNNNSVPQTGTGYVKPTGATMTFSDFTSPVGTSRYFQYRTVLESEDVGTICDYGAGGGTCSPEVKNTTIAPIRYDPSGATITALNAAGMTSLSGLTETLGASCSSGVSYNIGRTGGLWYWWDGTANAGAGGWVSANGTAAQSNSASVVAAQAGKVSTQAGSGPFYLKAFLNSSGSSLCELAQVEFKGAGEAPLIYFRDDFTGPAADVSLWNTIRGAAIQTWTGSSLSISPPPNTTHNSDASNVYSAMKVKPKFDLTNRSLQYEMSQALAGYASDMGFSVTIPGHRIAFLWDGTNVYYRYYTSEVSDTYTDVYEAHGGPTLTTYRYVRIRHSVGANEIYWETSADAVTWTTRRTITAPAAVSSVTTNMHHGNWSNPTTASPGTAVIEGILLQ